MTNQTKSTAKDGSILIVNDSKTNALLLKTLLTEAGYSVHAVPDGTDALAYIEATPPDLILLDIEMPKMNGYEVSKRLKESPETRDIPIIFISVHDDIRNIVYGFDVGGVDYITTPFHPEEVLARVDSHLTLVRQRRELELLHKQQTQQFDSINAMKNSFIQTATHDLKNPLFIISGYVDVLEMEERLMDNENLRLAVKGIQDGVEKMSSLIGDILDLVQVEAGIGLSMTPIVVADFLRDSVRGFDVLATQKGLKLDLLPPADAKATILADKAQFARVMDNLISNAIKYTPKGGWIKVKSHIIPNEIVIEVMDTGMGIPPESIPHLFNKFYRVDREEQRDIDGTGLGLTIVKAIVEQHNGTIRVTSKPGKGSAFIITLPRYENDTAATKPEDDEFPYPDMIY